MSDEQNREAGRQQWGGAADAWARAAEEEETGASASVTQWMLDAAGLQAGDRVLEIACGAARVGLEAAKSVRPGGSVLCSDFSQGMVDAAKQRIERNRIANAEARVLDAEDLDLDSESFDVVLCRFGYMLMADPDRALGESRRALRPGGRLILGVWGLGERNPWLTAVFDAVMDQLGAPPPPPGAPGPFALGDPARLRELLDGAALADVDVREIDSEQTYASLDAWWEELREVSGPLATLLDAIDPEDASAIKAAAFAAAERYVANGKGVQFPATVVVASSRRPS